MSHWPNNTSQGECLLEINVKFKKYGTIRYYRTSGKENLCSGDFIINKKLIEAIKATDEFFTAFNEGKIFDFVEKNGFTNIDSVLEALYRFHGENFIVDLDDRYLDKKGYTLSGEKVAAYWQSYIEDRQFKEYFMKQIDLTTQYDTLLYITIEQYYLDIECDKEYEKYILKFDGEQMSLFEEEDEDIDFW